MAYLPRGIAPDLLISQVKNTMPYLFAEGAMDSPLGGFPAAGILRDLTGCLKELSHVDYFRLCVSCHYLSCATPVPTDVDNQIRQKLWPAQLPLDFALEMADFVLSTRTWDFTLVSRRFVSAGGGALIGHKGEWFTMAAGAYCALRRYKDPRAAEKARALFENVADEVRSHSEIFGALWRGGDGLGCLKGAASIAHNFGDLDRVMDMWDLSIIDPFRLEFYGLAVAPLDSNRKLRHLGRLWVAGELYKSTVDGGSMALENHRHFALRKPRCLRQNPDLMITTGPFFDEWGRRVAGLLNESDLKEVVEALRQGWERLPRTVGYGRALRGISETFAEVKSLEPQERFEKKWAEQALVLMDEIPSRA
jgi:hypothetical protein